MHLQFPEKCLYLHSVKLRRGQFLLPLALCSAPIPNPSPTIRNPSLLWCCSPVPCPCQSSSHSGLPCIAIGYSSSYSFTHLLIKARSWCYHYRPLEEEENWHLRNTSSIQLLIGLWARTEGLAKVKAHNKVNNTLHLFTEPVISL